MDTSAMKTCYAVVSGHYSDYGVICVCLEQGLAEEVAARFSRAELYEGYRVEEMRLLESVDEQITRTYYRVEVDGEGNETSREEGVDGDFAGELSDLEQSHALVGAYHPYAEGRSERGYDVALKAARDALSREKARRAEIG